MLFINEIVFSRTSQQFHTYLLDPKQELNDLFYILDIHAVSKLHVFQSQSPCFSFYSSFSLFALMIYFIQVTLDDSNSYISKISISRYMKKRICHFRFTKDVVENICLILLTLSEIMDSKVVKFCNRGYVDNTIQKHIS